MIKRFIDLLGSAVLIFILTPVYILIALAIWISSGRPILFWQSRLGKDAVPFRIYKFRTMIPDAPDIRNPDGSTYNAADDPRLTPIGRFLRKTSLDELPQLFNVFKGEMSLVGPRPDQVDQLEFYSPDEIRKFEVKPGITGLAQVNGRNQIPWELRKKLDLEYVENISLWLDVTILIKTIPSVFSQDAVYSQPQKAVRNRHDEH